MVRKRLLLLLKPFDVFAYHELAALPSSNRRKFIFTEYEAVFNRDDSRMKIGNSFLMEVLRFLHDRMLVHKNTINFCRDILRKKAIKSRVIFRGDLTQPIRDVDLVVAIGGDGTLLHTTHFLDDSIPILGVNSDPTQPEEVKEFSEVMDATRSTGFLCASTVNNFEQMLESILENCSEPSELTRMAVSLNSKLIPTSALNDVLLAHPCPSVVSRFSFRCTRIGEPLSSLVHSRSSGLRVSTATGSTAAMLSAGGAEMLILSKDLQFMVREPICTGRAPHLMRGFVKAPETMYITWFCREGSLFIDGSHVVHSIQHGDTIKLSWGAPTLKVYLPSHLLSRNV